MSDKSDTSDSSYFWLDIKIDISKIVPDSERKVLSFTGRLTR